VGAPSRTASPSGQPGFRSILRNNDCAYSLPASCYLWIWGVVSRPPRRTGIALDVGAGGSGGGRLGRFSRSSRGVGFGAGVLRTMPAIAGLEVSFIPAAALQ